MIMLCAVRAACGCVDFPCCFGVSCLKGYVCGADGFCDPGPTGITPATVPMVDDCCEKGTFCCGFNCLPDTDRSVTCQAVFGGCCEDSPPPPPPPLDDCCPKGQFCCGFDCLPDTDEPVACPDVFGGCCEDPALNM
eukprot:jgi/Ulvmu1/5653/UM238_0002.1